MLELLHPEVEWNPPSASPEPHVRRGREAARDFMEPNLFDEQVSEPLEFLEAGNRILVVARTSVRGAASGIAVEQVNFHLWTIEDGLAVRFEVFGDREEALAALRGSE